MPKVDGKEMADNIRGRLTAPVDRAPAIVHTSPTAAPTDPVDQLRRLGELHDAGLLTVQEFQTKKCEILGRI
jgi:hypothetical protein